MATDILISTIGRPESLLETLDNIYRRTTSEYALHVIVDGNDYRTERIAFQDPRIENILCRFSGAGITANICAAIGMTTSDIVVLCDDDVLCPELEPDWLARGLSAMANHPDVAIMALNEIGSIEDNRRHDIEQDGEITRCEFVGGQFAFVRRNMLSRYVAHAREGQSPMKEFCKWMTARGYGVAYLTDVYCWHFGKVSARTEEDVSRLISRRPLDMKTLDPRKGFADA